MIILSTYHNSLLPIIFINNGTKRDFKQQLFFIASSPSNNFGYAIVRFCNILLPTLNIKYQLNIHYTTRPVLFVKCIISKI